MKNIIELWSNEELPIKDGVYFSNGKSFSISILAYPAPHICSRGWFDFEEYFKGNQEEVTSIDVTKRVVLKGGACCYVGEGSYGSEGFIAYENNHKLLEWVVYSESSNPFIDIKEGGANALVAESSAGFKIKISISNPEEMEVVSPDAVG
ncbi:hypothetical protein DK254_10800 [Pseudomonas sp. RW407]|nr:hypothetical protein DK254_10800 [Pseudomonas sp. RW407]